MDLGLSVHDGKILVDSYGNDMSWFIDQLVPRHRKRVLHEEIRLSNIIAVSNVSSKNADITRQKWVRKRVSEVEDIDAMASMTVLQRLKYAGRQRKDTIFNRLKRQKRKQRSVV